MNKSELIDQIAKSADLSKAAAGRALDATIAAVKGSLKKGGEVSLVGFGTFYVSKRAARAGPALTPASTSFSPTAGDSAITRSKPGRWM